MSERRSRRSVLRAVGGSLSVGGVGALAGCSAYATLGLPESPESGPAGPADPTGATATFRGGLARRGYYPSRSVPEDPEVAWSRSVNTGDHDAAKASAVPLYPDRDDAAVVVPGDDGTLYALGPDGDLLWSADVEPTERGMHGTPTVAGDTVYVGAYDGALYAFDRETGRRRWRVRLGDAIGSSPAYHDGRVYVAVEYIPSEGSLFAVDARTGEVRATADWPADHPHSTPAVVSEADRVVVGSNDGDLYAWTLALERAWEVETGAAVKGPVAVHDGSAFVGSWDHHLYRVALDDGAVEWRYETGDMVMSGAGIDPERGVVYVGSHDRHLHALDLDGRRRWRFRTGGWIIGCPSVVGDRVLVGSYDDRLYALEPDGDRAWSLDLRGRVTASARPVGGRVYVAERAPNGSDGPPGRVYAVA